MFVEVLQLYYYYYYYYYQRPLLRLRSPFIFCTMKGRAELNTASSGPGLSTGQRRDPSATRTATTMRYGGLHDLDTIAHSSGNRRVHFQ